MDRFKFLLSAIGNCLKSNNWKKQGKTFYFSQDNNWGLINFQNSTDNQEEILFTINLAVSSTVLRKFEDKDLTKMPGIVRCHWTERIGFLMPVNKDFWWEIDATTDLLALSREIIEILVQKGIPEIKKHMSDHALIAHWIRGESKGLTDFQRMVNLVILLKHEHHPLLIDYIKELENIAAVDPIARYYLKELDIRYGNR
ncbi:DUF4304 domain-containing protein [Chitinophaga nivalis]|uniref:DUF4304 domain-containing protein n=1 Tax=Chitinophaga nivalis TaxID=2991709 RepID=A0ABT3II70_9BACT|nr:DUF4304 domain-containing protein [Chitinophaga nivalis]MCW3466636.1 DUF4304 domain-containing protein [Chitinophaga nivalis]MCW3483673.1 DUF4304 domain-containing protein [Chitinophaga nivalis]